MKKEEISLLEEELVQLIVKTLLVIPSENSTLLCDGVDEEILQSG